jgi:glycerophosphoryl diester phosphodiesterase
MHRPEWIDRVFHTLVDGFYGAWPQPVPGPAALRACRLVSHRGEHDNRTVFENTLAAFDRALARGVWGIEFDLRWTRDLHPVVHHDDDLFRLLGSRSRICDLTLDRLRAEAPDVPTLEEVIRRYGGKMHLMMEVKEEPYPDPEKQNRRLAAIFSSLRPRADYHLLGLAPGIFNRITFADPTVFLLIGETRVPAFSRWVLENGWGGVCGHYLLVTERCKRRHRQAGQGVGTGYPASKNAFFREIRRGVDWIFSNHAGTLQAICNDALDSKR